MRKKVLLLAVSCKTGGLCPGGLDLDNPRNWIRIVKDDGRGGAVQGHEIDFAKPLDIIEFDGRPMPQGKQQENWVIDGTCKNKGKGSLNNGNGTDKELLDWVFQKYAYKDFWGNYKPYLDETEFANVNAPSESIMKVSNVRIYKNDYDTAKIDFDWSKARFRIKWVSMTDPDFYDRIKQGDVTFNNAYIVTSIPKECDWTLPETGEKRAYKFVSKIFEI